MNENAGMEKNMQNYMHILNHDLRSPLTTLIGLSDLLLEEQYSPQETQDIAVLINRTGKKMLKMIENYLMLEKIESGYDNLVRTPLSVLNLVNETKKSFSDLKTSGNIAVSLKRQDTDSLNSELLQKNVLINENLFTSLLSNLLRNAIEASLDRLVLVNIYEEESLCISFSNQGAIPDEIQEKLFQKFNTSKSTGTGLGLYSAKMIAEAHGGKLIYEPLTEGTRFVVHIPFA